MKDFGSIAITARVNRAPDARFVQSWTHLIAGGLRRGDKVFGPIIEMPHHWAASCAIRDFMDGCDCDTLLLVDDDMTFESDTLANLRDNPANHDFDMVQALCCSRQQGHGPIVLLESGTKYKPLLNPHSDSGTVEVGMCGLAFTIIRRKVIRTVMGMLQPDELIFNWGTDGSGEDCSFCRRARRAGYRIGVDTTVQVGHRLPVEVGWNLEKQCAEYSTYPNASFKRLMESRKKEQGG